MKKIIILSVSVFLMLSCGSDDSDTGQAQPLGEVIQGEEQEEQMPLEDAPVVEEGNQLLTYDIDIVPLIAKRCFQCHNDPTANGAPRSSTWVNFDIVSANATRINARVANGSMPPSGGLAKVERDIIAQWIADGMLEN